MAGLHRRFIARQPQTPDPRRVAGGWYELRAHPHWLRAASLSAGAGGDCVGGWLGVLAVAHALWVVTLPL